MHAYMNTCKHVYCRSYAAAVTTAAPCCTRHIIHTYMHIPYVGLCISKCMCLHIDMYMHVCINMCLYMQTHTCTNSYMYMYIYTLTHTSFSYMHMYMYTEIQIQVHTCTHEHARIYTCIRIYMCACVQAYVNKQTNMY